MGKIQGATRTARFVFAAVIACAVFAASSAFAASLGTRTDGLGADTRMSSSCGAGMTFAYTTGFYAGASGYAVTGVNLSHIPAGCLSKSLSVSFYNSSGNAMGSAVSATLPASGTTQSLAVNPSSNAIDVGQISGVSVVVS